MANKDLLQLARELNQVSDGMSKNLKRACFRIGSVLEAQTKLFIRNNPQKSRAFGGSREGLNDSGTLLGSIRHSSEQRGKTGATVTIGSYGVPYAAIHEFGGVIKAKKQWLTIPFSEKAKGLRVRNYPGGLFKPKNKNVLLDKDTGELAYILKKSVTIPARPYLRLAIERSEEKINQIIYEELSP